MAYDIDTISSANNDAHKQFITKIKNLATGNGWSVERYIDDQSDDELILKGEGLTGLEEIYVGFKTYQSVDSDTYNIVCGVFTGYVAGVEFEAQPNAQFSTIFCHNTTLLYVITLNEQKICGWVRVGANTYSHFYVGKYLPYARPSEFPYPVMCGGMIRGKDLVRHDDSFKIMPYVGYRYSTSETALYVRDNAGVWSIPDSYPWTNYTMTGSQYGHTLAGSTYCLAPIGDNLDIYQMEPIIMVEDRNDRDPKQVFGEVDGVFFCSGFDNGPENVIQIGGSNKVDQTGLTMSQAVDAIFQEGGRAFVMGQNNKRTAWRDYVAIEMVDN